MTTGQIAGVFGNRVTEAMLRIEGRYVQPIGTAGWWIPSGTTYFSPDSSDTPDQELAFAIDAFFLPHRHRDPFHTAAIPTESTVTYDVHRLLPERATDALGNMIAMSSIDYRVLQPAEVTDPNGNRAAAAYDALGLVVATAVMGKAAAAPAEGDRITADLIPDLTDSEREVFFSNPLGAFAESLLGDASQRFVHDLHAYRRSATSAHPQPAWSFTLARETHVPDPAPLRIQGAFAYSDGFGRQIQSKAQAEAGEVPARGADGQIVLGANGLLVMTSGVSARWVGTGWTVYNNKGNPVRTYEPFFTDTHQFEPDTRVGVTPILCHDPMGRIVVTVHPDHSWEKVVFDPWQQSAWDVNDTVLIADPITDPDVGGLLARLPAEDVRPTWYELRTAPGLGAERTARWPDPRNLAAQQRAATQTGVHAATPAVTHADSLGRAVLAVAHNRYTYSNAPDGSAPVEEKFLTRTVLDVEGNEREVIDALGRVVMRYDHDVAGRRIHQSGMDCGHRWSLTDVGSAVLYNWDDRGHQTRTQHDALRRPVRTFLQDGDAAEVLIGSTLFGESVPAPEARNLRTRAIEVRDQAGLVTTDEYDFKGNLLHRARQLARVYDATLDWAGNVDLLPGPMVQRTRYDALNRPVQEVAPCANLAGTPVSVVQRSYNEAGLLERVDSWLELDAEPNALLDPATASLAAVTGIDYDAKGQRQRIGYGNGVVSDYAYDRFTLRLARLTTRRDGDTVQDLAYTYEPTGNITAIRDDAQQTVFFRNSRIDPGSDYLYDATYRLIEATGREHLGQNGASLPSTYNDVGCIGLLHPGDGNAMGRYLERYVYDAAGNIQSLQHRGSDGANPGWTRNFTYGEASRLEPAKTGNRLTSSSIGSTTKVFSAAGDGYDQHGSMLRMPQLQEMHWDHRDQLRMTRRQAVDAKDADGITHAGERTWYVYDASGQRVRKVTESRSGVIKESRLYAGPCEVYERRGGSPLVRESLHLRDGKQRVALVETRLAGVEPGVPARLVRFPLANHLGSVALELDDQAKIISYEEYTPYGSSSYQAVRSQTEATKRYRYTGKEQDEESGLYYHEARYYAPWLGRWTSCDPVAHPNRYSFCDLNPIAMTDPSGRDPVELQSGPYRTIRGDHVHQVASRTAGPGASRASAAEFRSSLSVSTKSPGYNDAGGQRVETALNRAQWGTDANGTPAKTGRVQINASGETSVGVSRSATVSPWFEDIKSFFKLREAGLSPDDALDAVFASSEQLEAAGAMPQRVPNAPRSAPKTLKTGQILSPETPTQVSGGANASAGTPEAAPHPETFAKTAAADLEAAAGAAGASKPVSAPASGVSTALRVGGIALSVGGTAYSAYAFGEDISEGRWGSAALNGTSFAGGGLALGGTAVGSTALATVGTVIAAPAAVIGAGAAGWKIGEYTNENTAISDVAAAGGSAVERFTGSSTWGAIGAAGTAVVTAPVFVPIALGKGIGRGAAWLWNKAF